MLSARILSNVYRQTSNGKVTPILSLLNRNQFYCVNATNFVKPLVIDKKKKVIVTTIHTIQNPIFVCPSSIIVRYKSNLPTELPSKDQVQKYFFRILGFVLDVSKTLICWTIKIIQNIMEHPKTKQYWARLQNKIEDARKK